MPREIIDVTNFNYGQISEPDPRDIPPGAGTVCTNCDPNSYGILRGIYATGSSYNGTGNVKKTGWIVRDDGTRDLVYTDNSNIKSLLDFYGSPSAGNTISGRGYSFTPQNKKVFIGMGTSTLPKVAIRTKAAKFNGIIARTVGSGADDLIIDSSEYDGTTQIYYVKITSASGATGSFTSVHGINGALPGLNPALFYDAGHGLTQDNVGDTVVISSSTTNNGNGYDGTYKILSVWDDYFTILHDTGQLVNFGVQFDGDESGGWALQNKAQWKWSTDDSTYYPSSYGLSTKEFAKIGTHGLKARFIDETDKALNDKWTITFSSANSETLYIEDAECYNYQNNESTDSMFIQIETSSEDYKDTGFFINNKKYFYGWSIIYDISEESPIAYRGKGNNPTVFSTTFPLQSIDLNIKITTTSLPKRITGFNLWCAEANNNEAEKPEEEFKYIQSFNLDGARVSTNTYTFKFKDVGNRGLTYENYTDISEVVKSTSVNYTLSTVVNDKMFIGNCSHEGIINGSNMIFRSKARRYSMFDWTTELYQLPTKPTAMIGFRGRLYVWDESKLYIIEPEQFFVENEYPAGCPYPEGLIITETHLYWYDTNAAYRTDGVNIEDISTQKIKTAYQTIPDGTSFNGVTLLYDNELKIVMFLYRDGVNARAWSFHTLSERWDSFIFSNAISADVGYFSGKNGETYGCLSSGIYSMFSSASRRSWAFTSGKHMGKNPSTYKKFYKLMINASGTLTTATFKIDGGSALTLTNGDEIKVSGNWAKGKEIQVNLGDSTGKEAYSYSIEYRDLGTL